MSPRCTGPTAVIQTTERRFSPKRFKRFRISKRRATEKFSSWRSQLLESNGAPSFALDLLTDFNFRTRLTLVHRPPLMHRSLWGRAKWMRSDYIYQDWHGIRGVGRSGALRLGAFSKYTRVAWLVTNVEFTVGDHL